MNLPDFATPAFVAFVWAIAYFELRLYLRDTPKERENE